MMHGCFPNAKLFSIMLNARGFNPQPSAIVFANFKGPDRGLIISS